MFLLHSPHYLVTVPSVMQSMWTHLTMPHRIWWLSHLQNNESISSFLTSDLQHQTSCYKKFTDQILLNPAITLDTMCHLRVSQTHCFINSICFGHQTKNFLICPTERTSLSHGKEWSFNHSIYFTINMWIWLFYKITKLTGENDKHNTYITSTSNFINSPKASGDIRLSPIIQMKYIFFRTPHFLFSWWWK